jgi:hypothetical protein
VRASAAAADTIFPLGGLKKSAQDPIPYSREALRQDLLRVRTSWECCQANRDRSAIYGYLSAVFDLVMWWKAEDRAISRGAMGAAAAEVRLASHRRTVRRHHSRHR